MKRSFEKHKDGDIRNKRDNTLWWEGFVSCFLMYHKFTSSQKIQISDLVKEIFCEEKKRWFSKKTDLRIK